jgi:hypothetical protein
MKQVRGVYRRANVLLDYKLTFPEFRDQICTPISVNNPERGAKTKLKEKMEKCEASRNHSLRNFAKNYY